MAYKVECLKCRGHGYISAYAGIAGGVCFDCKGAGFRTYKNKPRRGTKYAFGTRDCFPQFWRKFSSDQRAADFAGREGKSVFMCEDEFNSRFASVHEAAQWAAGQ